MEYPYLAIDYDGQTYECKSEPYNNGLGRWFTRDFFGEDDYTIIPVENPIKENYLKIFDARKSKGLF